MGLDQPSGNPERILIWESVTTLVPAIAMLAIGFEAPAYHHEKRQQWAQSVRRTPIRGVSFAPYLNRLPASAMIALKADVQ